MASILIVDDEHNTCEALTVILRREGHTVSSAASGDSALSYLQDFPADLVVSDVKMPGMDGLSLLSRLKSQYPGLPVVMMSGHSDVIAAVEERVRLSRVHGIAKLSDEIGSLNQLRLDAFISAVAISRHRKTRHLDRRCNARSVDGR